MTDNNIKEIQPRMGSILLKIKKALALGHDKVNANESQTAMLLAQKLMLKHGLSASDIPQDKPNEKDVLRTTISMRRIEWWHRKLAVIIADNFRCEQFFSRGRYIGFLGIDGDVKIAEEVYTYARDAIKYHSSDYLRKSNSSTRQKANAIKNDYIFGYLQGLREKFKKQIQVECLELMLVKDDAVVKAAEKFKVAKDKPIKVAGDNAARNQGYEDGKKFENPKGRMIESACAY